MHDFSFKNIELIGKPGIDILPEASRLEGFSDEHGIRNFHFENIALLGKAAENARQLNLDIRKFADNITFENNTGKEPIGEVATKLYFSGTPILRSDGNYSVSIMLLFENVSKRPANGCVCIKASPKNSGVFNKSSVQYNLPP